MGSLFRRSAIVTFVIEILSVIVMLGSLALFYVERLLPSLSPELSFLLLLVGSILTLVVILIALSVFVRYSRRITDAVIGPGIQKVRMNAPRVRFVVYIYALLVILMTITGVYVWYLIDLEVLQPWVEPTGSIYLRVFGLALGAFFIALLIQIIVAVIGRTATKVIIEVLATDESEFLK
jgi:hypothetical protein